MAQGETQGLLPQERLELASLARESHPQLLHSSLLHLAARYENQDRLGLAAHLYSLLRGEDLSPELRNRAEGRLAVLQGGGDTGARAEFLLRRVAAQATDPVAIASMGVGGAVFRIARLGAMGRLLSSGGAHWANRGFGLRALSGLSGWMAESTAFTLTGRGLNAALGRPQEWSLRAVGQEWASGALTLAALRGFGGAASGLYRRVHGNVASPWQAFYSQPAMLGGILVSHDLEARLGLREHLTGSQALLEGLVTLLQFNVAGRLSREAFGRRWQAWEHDLDRRASRLGSGFHWPNRLGGLRIPAAMAVPAASLSLASRPGERLPALGGTVWMANGAEGKRAEGEVAEIGTISAMRPTEARGEAGESSIPPESKVPSWWPSNAGQPEGLREFLDLHPHTAVVFELAKTEGVEGLNGRILMANQRIHEMFGFSETEAVGMSLAQFTHPHDMPLMTKMHENLLKERPINFREVRFLRRDGAEFYCDVSGVMRKSEDRVLGFALLEDVSNRRRTREQLKAQQIRFQALLQAVPDLIFRISGEGEFLDAHAERPENFVVPPKSMVGKSMRDLPLPPQLIDWGLNQVRHALLTGERQRVEYTLPMTDGTLRHQEVRIIPSGENEVVAIARDVTDMKMAENNRLATARLEAMNESLKLVSRGLAHDTNNALSALLLSLDYSQRLLSSASEGGPLPDLKVLASDLRGAAQQGERIKNMIAGFRELSNDPATGTPFDLHSLLRLKDLQAQVGPGVELRIALSESPWLVPGPRDTIARIVQNLAVNARDAMARQQEPVLTLETERIELNAEALQQLAASSPGLMNLSPGNFMRLRVQDNGNGIHPNNLARIFEPYFSTKSKTDGAGHGGLGLALTHKIVRDAGGFITVQSDLGLGTTFDVYLPQAGRAEPGDATQVLSQARQRTLLVVSPEPPFLESVRSALAQRGFTRILTAQNHEEALALARNEGELGAVLVEHHLPNEQYGMKLLKTLRDEGRPELPALLWSDFDPRYYSNALGRFGTMMERSAPELAGGVVEDLLIRYLRRDSEE